MKTKPETDAKRVRKFRPAAMVIAIVLMTTAVSARALPALAQQATPPPLPTVTGTPSGPIGTVVLSEPEVNVRAYPDSNSAKIGVLLPGQQVVLKGRSPGGSWLLIDYPGVPGGVGWVWSALIVLPPGTLPIVEPPPTPTPRYTPTIDPTLAAEFLVTAVPTREPTFTPPPPLVIPTLPADTVDSPAGGLPMGLVIVGLASLGVFLGLISLIRGR
jgi:hypothetical protein